MFPFDIASKQAQIQKYEEEINKQDFWDDNEKAQKILQQNSDLKNIIAEFEGLNSDLEEIEILIELGLEEEDESIEHDIEKSIKKLEDKIDEVKIKTLLNGKYDQNNFKVKTLDMISDPEAGIKSVTLLIQGTNAYGYLKSEKGVHRIVRISPFDASGKRHTSFVSVDVTPELDDKIDVEINPNDLKIDTYRSSGAGGQHVNKTDSAVRITHIPTGIVVQCQNERSQFANKDTAMKMLKGKLIHLKELENKERIEDIQGKYSQITWGSQIRSYVFQPYKLVKDHRTNAEIGNVDSVMDGNINLFINEYLKMNKNQTRGLHNYCGSLFFKGVFEFGYI